MLSELFAGPWGPLIIFFLRIVDVSLATVRLLLTMRDARTIVPLIGFFEALVWVLAVGTAIQNLDSVWHLLGYSGGFASGTVVGLWIEGKLALGLATVRVMSRNSGDGNAVAEHLRSKGFGVTEFVGRGREGPVDMVYSVVKRRQVPRLIHEVESLDSDAFIAVEEPRAIRRGWMFGRRRT